MFILVEKNFQVNFSTHFELKHYKIYVNSCEGFKLEVSHLMRERISLLKLLLLFTIKVSFTSFAFRRIIIRSIGSRAQIDLYRKKKKLKKIHNEHSIARNRQRGRRRVENKGQNINYKRA